MLIAIIILILSLLLGVPIPFAFFFTSIYMIITLGYDPSFLIPYGLGDISSSVLLAIPLFILAGGLIQEGGMGNSLINFINVIIGKIKGGLGLVTIISCGVFGAISGSGAATMTSIGTILLPRLNKQGYNRGFSASLIASSSVLGMLIPPSSLMIIYAWLSNQSVLAAFLSTIIPGIILITLLGAVNVWYIKKHGLTPEEFLSHTNYNSDVEESEELGFWKALYKALPTVILALIILGGIYGGFMTTSEAAGISVIYSFLTGILVYRALNIKKIIKVFLQAAKMTGVIMIMMYGSMILSRLLIMENLPELLNNIIFAIADNKMVILILINIALVFVGMLMDDVSGVLISTPIMLPIAMEIGVDPIQFAAILSVNMGLGVVTPPAASLLYLAGRMANAKFETMIMPTTIMIVFAWIPTLMLTTFIPSLSLYLPRLILGY